MRLLASTCAAVFFWLSNVCVGLAQTPPTLGEPSAAESSPVPPKGVSNAEATSGVAEPIGANPPADAAANPQNATATGEGPLESPTASASAPAAEGNPAAYPPTAYGPSPGPSEGSTGVNRRYAYGVPAHSWIRQPGPGAREHEGLFARLSMGVGASQASYRESVDGQSVQDIATRGIAFLVDAAIGGRLVGNLLLHANLSASSTAAAQKDVDGARYAAKTIDSSTAMLGLGVTYYFMPYNAYATAAFGFAGFTESRDELESVDTDAGFGGVVLLGKEWWTGPRGEWGLGVALRFSYMAAPLEIASVESTMTGGDIGFVFGATYN